MKAATLKLRKTEPDLDPNESPEPALSWTGGSAAVAKVTTWLLLSCLVAGPFALLGIGWLAFASTDPASAPASTENTATDASTRVAVSAFAEEFVVTWLTTPRGEERQLTPFLTDAAAVTLPKVPWTATNPTVSDIAQAPDGTWSATVAVAVATTKEPAVRRYFQVPIAHDAGAMTALAVPTPIAGPPTAPAPRLNYRYRIVSSDTVAVAASDFLAAMLVGSGDITRFTSPGISIQPVTPAPYASLEVEEAFADQELTEADVNPATDRTVRLLLTVTAISAADQEISIGYALTMTAREGRWEVAAIDSTPQTLSGTESSAPSSTPEVTAGATTAPDPNTD